MRIARRVRRGERGPNELAEDLVAPRVLAGLFAYLVAAGGPEVLTGGHEAVVGRPGPVSVQRMLP
jgi:hypothetical protein